MSRVIYFLVAVILLTAVIGSLGDARELILLQPRPDRFSVGPETPKFGDNPYYYKLWCGKDPNLVYLMDGKCQKKFPSNFDRQWKCPVLYSTSLPGFAPDAPVSQIVLNTTALDGIPEAKSIELSLILVRRTPKGVFYKYITNGKPQVPLETWSSSKIFSAANGGGNLEDKCHLGMNANTQGNQGKTPLGDLMTIICSYDASKGYASNSLAKWFTTVGGRARLNHLITSWLYENQPTNESLAGSYGMAPPQDLSYTFTDQGRSCSIDPDNGPITLSNSISMFTASELTRRLALHRDISPERQFPGLVWPDVADELYGAENSSFFPGLKWGGMMSDISIFIQSALDMNGVEERSEGHWRIFQKLGDGWSDSSKTAEINLNSYSCLPVMKNGSPVVNEGVEFVLSAKAIAPSDPHLTKVDALMAKAIGKVVQSIYSGQIV